MMCYGYKCQEGDDPLIKIADIAVDGFSRSSAAGAWLVDIFPIRQSHSCQFPQDEMTLTEFVDSAIHPVLDAWRAVQEARGRLET